MTQTMSGGGSVAKLTPCHPTLAPTRADKCPAPMDVFIHRSSFTSIYRDRWVTDIPSISSKLLRQDVS